MFQLNDKAAMVTGAARGLGQAIAVKLAEAGADIALCDLNAEWLEETAEKVKALGRRAECYGVNVAEGDSVTEGVKAITKDFGKIDVLVNNAGITKDGLIMRMSEDDWDAVLNVNLKGVFLCTKAAMRGMMKQRSGTIVNIASVIGLMGNAGQANYAASKGGVISFSKTVAKELASRNVRCNAVAPGFIRTAMTDALDEEVQNKMKELIPLSRFGEPEDVANVVLFLASDASAYVTGQVLSTCGGMVM
ncbi:3-oxoacyl-[acyl-carrier-protein] reductase [Pontiella sulfatireligans]|uniref:3-oxoacyl-[acyl-carrier-protein] reductase n=1 Tax=Pontiella sulfatireligans TaxID=2750658 RepID=A0A6C2UNF3_9BACT|nr:3-oxoacyl-[acyl-carrier-protein] reductase [Pontiella sulfatireligans]VGO20576.1 3-oxoacyl-[acyl-carrier-protein] reductase FabG [Pontiella sulfatireligans]